MPANPKTMLANPRTVPCQEKAVLVSDFCSFLIFYGFPASFWQQNYYTGKTNLPKVTHYFSISTRCNVFLMSSLNVNVSEGIFQIICWHVPWMGSL